MYSGKVSKVLDVQDKLACITLDFERDYGDRIGEFNILRDEKGISQLARLFDALQAPVSAFVQTELLTAYPACERVIRMLAGDYHAHSHTHTTRDFDNRGEIVGSAKAFEACFGYPPLGYRAPLGVLHEGDIEAISESGYKFSSSVFPTWKEGKAFRAKGKGFFQDSVGLCVETEGREKQ